METLGTRLRRCAGGSRRPSTCSASPTCATEPGRAVRRAAAAGRDRCGPRRRAPRPGPRRADVRTGPSCGRRGSGDAAPPRARPRHDGRAGRAPARAGHPPRRPGRRRRERPSVRAARPSPGHGHLTGASAGRRAGPPAGVGAVAALGPRCAATGGDAAPRPGQRPVPATALGRHDARWRGVPARRRRCGAGGQRPQRGVGRDALGQRHGASWAATGRASRRCWAAIAGQPRPPTGRVRSTASTPSTVRPRDRVRTVGLVPQDPDLLLYAESVAAECRGADRDFGMPPARPGRCWPGSAVRSRTHATRATCPRDSDSRSRSPSSSPGQPRVVLLDEPTRGLDYRTKRRLVALLREMARDGHAVVVATHDVELAAEVADRVIVLADGDVVADGAAREILSASPAFAPQVAKILHPVALAHGGRGRRCLGRCVMKTRPAAIASCRGRRGGVAPSRGLVALTLPAGRPGRVHLAVLRRRGLRA